MSRLAPQIKRKNRRRWIWLILAPIGVLLAIPPPPPHGSPARLIEKLVALGPADDNPLVGASRIAIKLPVPVALAGYGPLRGKADGAAVAESPLYARAMCVDGVAIATLEILEVPEHLSVEVERRAKSKSPAVRAVMLAATHTHSGPGGFDANPLAQLGTRRYDPVVFSALADAAAHAVTEACEHMEPVLLRIAGAPHQRLKIGRGVGAVPDPTLRTLSATAVGDGHRVAELVLFGAHPTLLPRTDPVLSGDWPAAVAKRLEQDGSVALVAQGVGGDASVNRAILDEKSPPTVAFANQLVKAIASDLDDADGLSGQVAYAKVEVTLPVAEAGRLLGSTWDFLPHGALDRLLGHWLPKAVPLAGMSIGPVSLLCIPGEITGAAVDHWSSADPDLDRLPLMTLCGGDVSYIEGPDLVKDGKGERLVLYGPGLADAIWIGAEAVLSALGSDAVASSPSSVLPNVIK
jgi:neutral ceramidase